MTPGWAAVLIAVSLVSILNSVLILGLLRMRPATAHQASQSSPALGLEPGERIGGFAVVSDDGRLLASADLFGPGPAILLLLEPDCEPCHLLNAQLTSAVAWTDADVRLLVAVPDDGPSDAVVPHMDNVQVVRYKLRSVPNALRTNVSPNAFLVDRGGTVLDRAIPQTLEDLNLLATSIRTEQRQEAGRTRS